MEAAWPPLCNALADLGLELDQAIEDLIQTSEHGDLVDALGNTLQRLQLLHAQSDRVALHHLGGVEQGTRGSGFLTATDHVGLSSLFGFNDLRQDGLHLAGQYDVLHAGCFQIDAISHQACLDVCHHDLIDHGLVLQQLIERARTHGRSQTELQLTVQVFRGLLQLRVGLEYIGEAPRCRQVQAQADLVLGEDVLAGHLHHLQTQVHQLDRNVAVVLPEAVRARLQKRVHLAVDMQHAHAVLGHLHGQHTNQTSDLALTHLRLRQARHQFSRKLGVVADVQHINLDLVQALPVQTARGGRQQLNQYTVLIAQAHLGFLEVDAHELGFHHSRLLGHQIVGQAVREGGLLQRECLDTHIAQCRGQPVTARLQHALEVAIAQQQATLVLFDSETFESQHG